MRGKPETSYENKRKDTKYIYYFNLQIMLI
jgi:hypothetical protein